MVWVYHLDPSHLGEEEISKAHKVDMNVLKNIRKKKHSTLSYTFLSKKLGRVN
jgi:hypothetical protein